MRSKIFVVMEKVKDLLKKKAPSFIAVIGMSKTYQGLYIKFPLLP